MSEAQFIQVLVGGLSYSIAVSDIEKYPGSFFECMIKKEWLTDQQTPITIERDGALFKYVYGFLITNNIPRDKHGLITLSIDDVEAIKAEADFFGLDDLRRECNNPHVNSDFDGFFNMNKYIMQLRCGSTSDLLNVEYSSELIHALKRVRCAFCRIGRLHKNRERRFYENSTVSTLRLNELIAAATPLPNGPASDTVTNPCIWEIPATQLILDGVSNLVCEKDLSDFAPHLELGVHPHKLMIHQKGGYADAHRDTVRGENHIGTLVVILNSEYTGGELEVSHGGRTESVTGAYNWVAMHGDCLHKINPVTSGTRVSLIYDIYGYTTLPRSRGKDAKSAEDFYWIEQMDSYAYKVKSKRLRQISEEERVELLQRLDTELRYVDSLLITLQHFIPDSQPSPAFLKGGDRALYDLLSEQYEVQVVTFAIYRQTDDADPNCNFTRCQLYSPLLLDRTAVSHETDSDTAEEETSPEEEEEEEEGSGAEGSAASDDEESTHNEWWIDFEEEKEEEEERCYTGGTKVLFTNHLDDCGYLECTSESEMYHITYVATGLFLKPREV